MYEDLIPFWDKAFKTRVYRVRELDTSRVFFNTFEMAKVDELIRRNGVDPVRLLTSQNKVVKLTTIS